MSRLPRHASGTANLHTEHDEKIGALSLSEFSKGLALSGVAWVAARVLVAWRWPAARNPFQWNPVTWLHWDSKNYLVISIHQRTFGACGTPGFPNPFYAHFKWCGTAAWLPGYPTAIRWLFALGIARIDGAFLLANLAIFVALVIVWFGWLRPVAPGRSVIVLLLFAVFPGAVYSFALFPVSLALAFLVGGIAAGARRHFLIMAVLLAMANLCYPSAWLATIGIVVGLVVLAFPEGLLAVIQRGLWGAASFVSVGALFLHDQVVFGHFNAFFLLEAESKPASTIFPGIPSDYPARLHALGLNFLLAQLALALALVLGAVAVIWFTRSTNPMLEIDVLSAAGALAVVVGLMFSLSPGSWNRSIFLAAPAALCFRRAPLWALLVVTTTTAVISAGVSFYFFNDALI